MRPIFTRARALTLALIAPALLVASSSCGDDDNATNNNNTTSNNEANNTENNATNNNANNDYDDMVVSWEGFADRPCPDDTVLTWDNFGGPFVLNWCTGCHSANLPEGERAGATLGVDFDTVEDVQQWRSVMWVYSADDNLSMPPVGGPGPMDRFYFGEWLACGAP